MKVYFFRAIYVAEKTLMKKYGMFFFLQSNNRWDCHSETLQNLPYFWNMKIQIGFFFSNFGFVTNGCPGQSKVAQNDKKNFSKSYSKKMANFEAFR